MAHTPHDSRQRPTMPRRPTARTALALVLAGVVMVGGVVWQRYAASNALDSALIDAPMRSASDSSAVGYSELAIRDEQIRVWNIALQADTGSSLVLGQLAAYHMQRAREGGGWSDYLEAEALARHSMDGRLHRNGATAVTLVNTLLAQHRFAEAEDIASDLVQREPDIPEYRALLGEVAMEIGDDQVADSMLRSVWQQREQLSMAPRVARWLELTNHVSDARAILTRATRDANNRRDVTTETKAWFFLRLGDLELRAGNVRRADRAYRNGLAVEPGDPRLFAAMARLATANGDFRKAIAWGERAITMQLDPATLGIVGDAYAAVGDSAKAAEYFTTLEIAVAGQPGAYHRAWSLYLLDHGLRIDTVLTKAADELAERRDVYGYDLMAWALHKAGRNQEAQRMMQQALRFNTPDPLLRQHAKAIAKAIAEAASVTLGSR